MLGLSHFYTNYNNPELETVMNNSPDLPANFNFVIQSSKEISTAFTANGIADFKQAAAYVKQLPYKRNKDKYNIGTVLTDGHGTCSTKHALLKQLAIENDIKGIRLMLCIFKMSAANTPKIAQTLQDNGLDFILEAHNYLMVDDEVWDCTNVVSGKKDFFEDEITAIEIEPSQINEYKVNFHKEALQDWLRENPGIKYPLDQLFAIREKCIEDLSRF